MNPNDANMIELNEAEIAAVAGGKHGADDKQPDDRGNDGPGHDVGDDRGVDPAPHQ